LSFASIFPAMSAGVLRQKEPRQFIITIRSSVFRAPVKAPRISPGTVRSPLGIVAVFGFVALKKVEA